jgi:hypothetical protein
VTDRVPAAAAVGFQANAAAYERSRPSYPPEAVAHIVGHAGLVWNTRDRGVAWVRAFGDLLVDGDVERPYDSYDDVDYAAVVAAAGGFTPLEVWHVAWEQDVGEDVLVDRAASVSVVGAMPPERRAVVLDRVRTLARTHPDLAGRDRFGFPHRTAVHRCRAR